MRQQPRDSMMSRERMLHAAGGHMQRPRGEREPAMSGRPQEVQHDWSGKCQGVATSRLESKAGPEAGGPFK